MDEELKKAAYLGLNLVDFEDHFPPEYATMQEVTTTSFAFPSTTPKDVLSEVLRHGAQAMLRTAVEAEVAEWIEGHAHLSDERGHRVVVRNGYLPERSITTGIGQVKIRQPRVHDRRAPGEAEPFSSKILPPYLRKTRSIEELLPWLYLKGISTGDFATTAVDSPQGPVWELYRL